MGDVVNAVAEGKEGYDYARCKDYDVIVLDLMLPGMGGLAVLKEVSELDPDMVVVMITAFASMITVPTT